VADMRYTLYGEEMSGYITESVHAIVRAMLLKYYHSACHALKVPP